MNIKIPALLRRLTGALARPPQEPETYPCLMTDEDVSALLAAATVYRLGELTDNARLRLPSGIVITAAEARRWHAENTARCMCPECQAENLGEAAAEMGLVLRSRRVRSEFLDDDISLAEHMMFGYLMAFATDGAELDWTHRVAAEYQASVDAGDLDGKD